MAGMITGASIIGGELILGLSDGQIINVGYVQGTQGPKGQPGPIGPQGADGADGLNFLSGPRKPTPDDGVQGEWWLDSTAMTLWGPKEASGRWPGPVYLRPSDIPGTKTPSGQRVNTKQLERGARSFGSGQAFIGGGPGGGLMPAPNGAGLDRIIGNVGPYTASGDPLNPNWMQIAGDPKGDVMHVLIHAQSADGSWYGEVVATRDGNRDTAEVIAWETPLGTTPPQLDFEARIGASNVLELYLSSNIDIDVLRGKIIFI